MLQVRFFFAVGHQSEVAGYMLWVQSVQLLVSEFVFFCMVCFKYQIHTFHKVGFVVFLGFYVETRVSWHYDMTVGDDWQLPSFCSVVGMTQGTAVLYLLVM